MKICANCGEANFDSVKFCSECGKNLFKGTDVLGAVPSDKPSFDLKRLTASISNRALRIAQQRKADVMFVLDCTGSMQGEIDAIKETIIDFAATIKTDGVQVRVGLVEFRDRFYEEEHRALQFNGQSFTNDPALLRKTLSSLIATGGGDAPESSLDAMMLAIQQPFDPSANKVLVLITDAPPHIPDVDTQSVDEVTTALKTYGINQCYLVIPTGSAKTQIYLRFLEETRGLAFDLGQGDDFRKRSEDFKKTLMRLGRTISTSTV